METHEKELLLIRAIKDSELIMEKELARQSDYEDILYWLENGKLELAKKNKLYTVLFPESDE